MTLLLSSLTRGHRSALNKRPHPIILARREGERFFCVEMIGGNRAQFLQSRAELTQIARSRSAPQAAPMAGPRVIAG